MMHVQHTRLRWQLALIFGLIPPGVLHQHERHWLDFSLNDACWGNVYPAEAFYIEKDSRVAQRGSDRHVLGDQASNFALSVLVAWSLVNLLQELAVDSQATLSKFASFAHGAKHDGHERPPDARDAQ